VQIAAVLGGARGAFDELAAAGPVDAVFAVNDAAVMYPGQLAAFVTLHHEKLPGWLEARRKAGRPDPADVVAPVAAAGVRTVVDYLYPGMTASGSSGLYGAKVALERGYAVILCGVPMEATRAHFFSSTPWGEVGAFRDAWDKAWPFLHERVRSLSGWTAKKLGQPSPEWRCRMLAAQN
jgi:hypothetical protein